MTAVAQETFDSLSPATDEVVGTYPVHSPEQVRDAVARARGAAAWWASLGFGGRADRLRKWAGIVTRRMDELCAVVQQETGKPRGDAQLEVVLAIEHIAWAARHAPKVLGRKRRSAGLLLSNHTASVEYVPLGVIGVIGPWNYPVYTPLGSITYALAAGNAVVFKPSEYTPGVGKWLADTFAEVVPEQPVFQLVTGFGRTGAALVSAGVDKIAFTGSTATGKKIMAAAAETLTPVVIEAGGKDALLVDSDADVDAAADAAVWGAFSNSGQTCIGVERVYVHEDVYDRFVGKVVELTRDVEPGKQYGPITMPAQLDVIRRHIADALARGGRALTGGADAVGERYVRPTVLVDVPEDSEAVTEETFGPTVTIAKVRSMDEAVEKANATRYGLGSTVFSRHNGTKIAAKLKSGMTSINAPFSFAGIGSLPFGGVGDSGFGRIHGPEGLREFARPKAVARQRFSVPIQLTTFTRGEKTDRLVGKLVTILHGRGGAG
ncbi:acyl-CoA reductase-like NAD-dependent aldehyde dehydrogenase [Amycolatopsis bartoniae]|uniref:Aldehyde dehydrogenase n=1 Tax=Amycolatopsis bartoniae TaxID=941986 RepID=A0A8H9ISZ1_9PSEU|nr:aldehyde dehydrogenase family protein [Amycolatopsis bartoniae]MBB2933056.1 acyl-CoA reductase-like NAD-dependent aldehyde dehydrogenase [Amycolatopsis bartoniae]TVT11931.1 aldehyde dehydrogenase family protein [Amycolatopsis bartoniae]GHF56719.1 aldehyde dehydrogenase [Amycolatopsis bartoniae]